MPVIKASTSGVMTLLSVCRERLAELLRPVSVSLLAGCLASGCTVIYKPPVFEQPKQATQPHAQQTTPAPKKLPRATILLSDDVPAYTGIADELESKLPEKPVIINLQGKRSEASDHLGRLDRSESDPVVAIGPLAAHAAREHTTGHVVFCQVFNYQDLGLTAARMQGVEMLPPPELQFRAWKSLDPGLTRVGVITSQGHDALISRARQAAREFGIELEHRVVQSDKEMLYAFKRLTPNIQGLWLLPDDRVLSRRVLRDIMAYSTKHELHVVVFHPELLRLGGLMSVSSVDSDIAAQIIAALHSSPERAGSPDTGPLPLSKIRIEINPALAHTSALQSTLEYRADADAP